MNTVEKVCAMIEGHGTRQEAHRLEVALMRDTGRSRQFDRVGIALASGWFGQTHGYYTHRSEYESIPELIGEAADVCPSPKRPGFSFVLS